MILLCKRNKNITRSLTNLNLKLHFELRPAWHYALFPQGQIRRMSSSSQELEDNNDSPLRETGYKSR